MAGTASSRMLGKKGQERGLDGASDHPAAQQQIFDVVDAAILPGNSNAYQAIIPEAVVYLQRKTMHPRASEEFLEFLLAMTPRGEVELICLVDQLCCSCQRGVAYRSDLNLLLQRAIKILPRGTLLLRALTVALHPIVFAALPVLGGDEQPFQQRAIAQRSRVLQWSRRQLDHRDFWQLSAYLLALDGIVVQQRHRIQTDFEFGCDLW